ncbi:MAG TPA: GntR family transcriptional regulator [Verrucomicrobiae bacterium]|nr:GntR family transcriptional regulator [Verrucomicrobiae bacterium]
MRTSLTVHEVQEALEERIAKGLYVLGQRLPPLRSIAAELGTSPSTVSRAVQEMIRRGWLEVQERQFVRVRSQLPDEPARQADMQRAIRSIAHKWKLWGGEERELLEEIKQIVSEVYEGEGQFVFTECNPADLTYLGDQLAGEFPTLSIGRSLIADLDSTRLRQSKSVVLVPYYHYAEVKEAVGQDVSIVPVHTSPSAETLDQLLTMPAGSQVLVVGHNKRSVTRLSEIVRDYVEAKITGITEEESDKLAKLAPEADCVFAVWSAADAAAAVPGVKRVIVVRFALDTSLGAKLKMGSTMLAE